MAMETRRGMEFFRFSLKACSSDAFGSELQNELKKQKAPKRGMWMETKQEQNQSKSLGVLNDGWQIDIDHSHLFLRFWTQVNKSIALSAVWMSAKNLDQIPKNSSVGLRTPLSCGLKGSQVYTFNIFQ